MNIDLNMFRSQIKEDLDLIKEQYYYLDENLRKPEFAFNYWIISKIYSIDEELIPDSITEYNDKGIDCYVHFKESKKLYIIQNKYYDECTRISRNSVSDFLNSPLAALKNNQYRRSEELQEIFEIARNDENYKIYFYYFTTAERISSDVTTIIKEFNKKEHGLKCFTNASIYLLKDLYELYYGKNYREEKHFEFKLGTTNKGTFAALREEYGADIPCESFYVLTPIVQLYNMVVEAEK